MIIVVPYEIIDEKTGFKIIVASHGYNTDTGRNVILPPEPMEKLGAVFNQGLGEWIMPDKSVMFHITRNYGHPTTNEPGWDLLEVVTQTEDELSSFIDGAQKKYWKLWERGRNYSTKQSTAALYKPSRASSQWNDLHCRQRKG